MPYWQSNTQRIEQPSQYSVDRAAKSRQTRSLQPGGFPIIGECYSDPAPSVCLPIIVMQRPEVLTLSYEKLPQYRSCRRSFRYECVPQDSPRSTKRQRHIEDPNVEYWLSHRCQVSTAPLIRDPMEYLHARPTTFSLRRTNSSTGLDEPSETSSRPRNKYDRRNFETFLRTKGSFMDDYSDGLKNESLHLCQELLQNDLIIVPRNTAFDDSIFSSVCSKLESKNETRVVRIISELIVPSADIAICRGHVKFKHLAVSISEAWSNSVSLDADPITTDPPLQSQQLLKLLSR